MQSILIATFPAHGHVTPLLTVAEALVARGDRVRFLTGARFAGVVEATGAEYLPLPADADFDDRQDLRELFPERTGLKGVKSLAFDVENVFVRPGRAQYEAVMAADAAQPADVVLADPALVGAALLLGHRIGARPQVVVCGVVPLTIASRDTAPYGMGLTPLRGPLGRLRNAVLSELVARTVFPGAEHLADQAHRQVHGTPLPFPVLDWPRHADAIVQFTVPEFEYPRSDAPASAVTSPGRSRPPVPGPPCHPGGVTSTAHARSSTSPREPSPTATTGRSSPRPSRHSPATTTSSSWPPPEGGLSTPSPHCRRTPARRSTCRTTNCCP